MPKIRMPEKPGPLFGRRTLPVALLLVICAAFLIPQARARTRSVTLRWNASTTPAVEGYNIYRAPCHASLSKGRCPSWAEGPFQKIASATGTSYTDPTVVPGAFYSYYVTAFCPPPGCSSRINGESLASAHMGARVPK